MTEISVTMVKSLRDHTGAGIMNCKLALEEAAGDEAKAIEILQVKGLMNVAEDEDTIAAEGVVHSYIHGKGRIGVLVEINCQTDFVARNDEFQAFVSEVGMQIASASPEYVRRENVPEDVIESQKRIFNGQLEEEAQKTGKTKPPMVIEKIIEGKLNKWFRQVCLFEQESMLRDGDKDNFAEITSKLSVKIGEKISVRRFVRYEVGEGFEKQKHDIASEVALKLGGTV